MNVVMTIICIGMLHYCTVGAYSLCVQRYQKDLSTLHPTLGQRRLHGQEMTNACSYLILHLWWTRIVHSIHFSVQFVATWFMASAHGALVADMVRRGISQIITSLPLVVVVPHTIVFSSQEVTWITFQSGSSAK